MYLKFYEKYERASGISDSFSTWICWDLAMDLQIPNGILLTLTQAFHTQ